jgi:capsular polysaccharide biosynthesis protein
VELSQYLHILRRRWWIILVAVVVTAASGFLFARLQTPEYQSTVEVIIQPARPDLGLTQSAKWLLRTYMTRADSNQWAQDVIDALRLDMEAPILRSNARFSAEEDRMVIRIEIEDTDPQQANRIALQWAEQLRNWRDEQNQYQRKEDRVYAELRDDPTYAQAWPPRRSIVLAAGGILGLVIALVVIFFLEWAEAGVLRTPRDVEQWTNMAVLGAIPPTDA